MNKLISALLLLLVAVSGPAPAAEVAANIGFMSDYIFRGVQISSSAANGGIDLTEDDFTEGTWYVGTWLADVGGDTFDGIEYDLYGGWGSQKGDWSYGGGLTAYFYTDNFDSDFYELNLTGGYNLFTLDVAIGTWDISPTSQDYTFVTGTFEKAGFHGIVGLWFQDFDGGYLDFGYGNTLAVQDTELFDWSISLIRSFDIEVNQGLCGTSPCPLGDDTSIVLEATRSFGVWKKK
jgi:uncharacterized protein (TIGR02001 family)